MLKIMYSFIAILFVTTAGSVFADVKLPALISDNMVLQQNSQARLWGWADADEEINLNTSWQKESQKTFKADEKGKWEISINTPKAGGPYSITIKANNTITLNNILIGEVWIGSGQSNMEMPLANVSNAYTGIEDFANEIASANYSDIRLFQVDNFSSKEPLEDVQPGVSIYGIPLSTCKWKACTPETIPMFSSTAYFFARQLHKELGVPIGIIDASWGGTLAEAWTPISGLKAMGLQDHLKIAEDSAQDPAGQNIPTRLYNGMIHPLRHFRIKGVIWYQGESNTGAADKYRELFSTMINHWRDAFGYEFSFYFVQISPYGYQNINSAYLRQAQLETMLSVPKTGMAVTMDIGNLTDIHPKNKQEVGRRLALWALANDYGQKNLVYSGPIYKAMEIEGSKIRILFDHIGSGLLEKDGSLTDFTIAGEDKEFVNATATIENDTIVVSSDQIAKPVAVRFAFTNTAVPNLFNKEAMPASPFRTDTW